MNKTNNSKVVDKDYLAEQFYNYHKQYMVKGVEETKQNKLEPVTNSHIKIDGSNIDIKIINDLAGTENDYLSLNSVDNGEFIWKTPITNQSELKDSDRLTTGKSIYNFDGSENIHTLGEITKGTWKVENVEINGEYIKIGKYTFSQLDGNLLIAGDENVDKVILTNLQAVSANFSGSIETDSLTANSIDSENILSNKLLIKNEITVSGNLKTDAINPNASEGPIEINSGININGDMSANGNVIIKTKDEQAFSINGVTDTLFSTDKDKTMIKNLSSSTATIDELNITKDNIWINNEQYYLTTQKDVNEFFNDIFSN